MIIILVEDSNLYLLNYMKKIINYIHLMKLYQNKEMKHVVK